MACEKVAVVALSWVAFVMMVDTVTAFNGDGDRPCLPDQQEFWGTDTKHPYKSYFAVDFKAKYFGIKRQSIGKMVKDYSCQEPLRYDISPANCYVSKLTSQMDVPQCVPEDATKQGKYWTFRNIDGATLFYAFSNPSYVARKVSPDGKVIVTFSDWNNTISDSKVFIIPSRCPEVHGH